jgi:hypothetical protein
MYPLFVFLIYTHSSNNHFDYPVHNIIKMYMSGLPLQKFLCGTQRMNWVAFLNVFSMGLQSGEIPIPIIFSFNILLAMDIGT